jgi:1,4-dihydroxy-2-naphthoate octaprenyltransferase
MVQILVNIHNDLKDFEKGADTEDRLGEARAAQKGWLSPAQLKGALKILVFIAGVITAALTWIAGWPVVIIGVASILSAFAYTGGPFPLAYNGLGDLFVFLFFGLVAVMGTTYVITETVSIQAFWAGLIVGAHATAILVVNNIRDRLTDAPVNKRTLVVRFGASFGRWEYILCLVGGYVLLAWAIHMENVFPLTCYGAFLSAPLALHCIRALSTLDGADLNPWLGKTAQVGLLSSVGLAGGMLL